VGKGGGNCQSVTFDEKQVDLHRVDSNFTACLTRPHLESEEELSVHITDVLTKS